MATTNNISPSQGNSPTRTEREFTMNPTNTNQVPRTVIGVSRLCSEIDRYDKAYERAVSRGNLGRAKDCEQHLYELDSLLARVSDRVWSMFCAVEEQDMMGVLVEVLGEDA